MTSCQPRILVVDDDSFFRALVEKLLSSAGYEVIEARSAHEGEQNLWRKPDLAIIDYRMQGADGVSLIRKIREDGLAIPIIFCSGSGYSAQTLSCLRNVLKVELVIPKPIVPAEFLRQVAALLPQSAAPQGAGSSPSFASAYNSAVATASYLPSAISRYARVAGRQELDTAHICGNGNSPDLADNFKAVMPFETEPRLESGETFGRDQRLQSEKTVEIDDRLENLESSRSVERLVSREASRSVDSCEIEDLVGQVRQEYLEQLRLKWPEFKERICELLAGRSISQSNKECVDSVLAELHTIKGTAGSVGLSDLSQTAGELESLVSGYFRGGHEASFEKISNLQAVFEYWLWGQNPGVAPGVFEVVQAVEQPLIVSHSQPILRGRLLLVGSDDEATASLSTLLCSYSGLETMVLSEPLKVLLELETFHPDLILIDERVGDISVLDLLALIRSMAHWNVIPIIISISSIEFEFRNALYQAGATDYVAKPLTAPELQYRLSSAIVYHAPKTM